MSIDFYEVAEHYALVVIDDYSIFPEVEIVHWTSAKAVLPKLNRIFAAYGEPKVVKSDNGPPFNGHEFGQSAYYLGFEHRKVTPLWPEANGEVKCLVKTFGTELEATAVPVPTKLSNNSSLYYWCCSYHRPYGKTNQDQAALLCCCYMQNKSETSTNT